MQTLTPHNIETLVGQKKFKKIGTVVYAACHTFARPDLAGDA
jgi:hypothetical protein